MIEFKINLENDIVSLIQTQEKHFEDEVERKMMWDLLKTLKDKGSSELIDNENQDNENDFMKDIVDTVTMYDAVSYTHLTLPTILLV